MRNYWMLFFPFLFLACTSHYSMHDFEKVKKIDMHVHLNTASTFFPALAFHDNFTLITLNTDAYSEDIVEQERIALVLARNFPDKIFYLSTFSMNDWDSVYWADSVLAHIQRSVLNGARGIKVWKNIGMAVKDRNGNFIMIDNPRFDTLFRYFVMHHIPVVGHCGEPRNCWLPLDQMTVSSDKNYFSRHPEYHMYNHPEYPSYEEQIAARDRLLEKNPGLIFIGAHLGSLEWDVDEIAKRFEKFPDFYVDLAGRVCYLELQAKDNWQKVRDFLIKYSNRILYGSDLASPQEDDDLQEAKKYIHQAWVHHWQFFVTADTMRSDQFEGSFRGLHLPRKVIDDIYYNNAARIFLTHKIIQQ